VLLRPYGSSRDDVNGLPAAANAAEHDREVAPLSTCTGLAGFNCRGGFAPKHMSNTERAAIDRRVIAGAGATAVSLERGGERRGEEVLAHASWILYSRGGPLVDPLLRARRQPTGLRAAGSRLTGDHGDGDHCSDWNQRPRCAGSSVGLIDA
jgi:hypothetical protein